MIGSTLLMALRAIRRNALRSFLTTLGIVIGVAAVIAMVTLGRGASARVTADVASLGNNLLIVAPGADRRQASSGSAEQFTMDDVRAIRDQVPGIAELAPSVGTGARVVYGNRNWSTGVTGSDNGYFAVRNWAIDRGRAFDDAEIRGGATVCVLGATVARELFGSGDPLGASIRVAHVSCEVIGVLVAKGRSTFGDDQDDFLVMPLLAFQRRLSGNDKLGVIFVSARDEGEIDAVKRDLETLMRHRRRVREGEEDDFVVRDMQEISTLVATVTGVLTTLLGSIAAVSLLVGGIGIMNIMLVSVTERTREIGIRMAIGARSREVLAQFLVEAVVLSALGGVLGIALGLVGSYVATRFLSLPFVAAPDVVLGAVIFAAAVGVCFGFFPALKAARLEPIDALRYE